MTNTESQGGRYDLTDLRLFLAVADTGSVSRGAQRCHLAPSSASLRIAGLESVLGVRLFERQARGVTLTQPGQILLEHARSCLAGLGQMHADLAPFAAGISGQITLMANSNAIASFLPADLPPFLVRHPAVRLSLEERLSAHIVAAVAAGRADVGLVAWDGDHPGLSFRPYRDDELVLLVAPGHRLARRQRVRFSECMKEPVVSLQGGAAIHTFIVERAAELGQRLDIRVQLAGFQAVAQLVAAGVGVGIVPRSVACSVQTKARMLRLDEPWALRRLRLCMRRDGPAATPMALALVEHLASFAPSPAGGARGTSD